MSVRTRKRQPVKRKFTRREIALAKRKGERLKRYRKPRARKVRPRLDPRDLWPEEKDFMARFRLPVELVEHLTELYRKSRACRTKGDRRGRGIPLFHKGPHVLVVRKPTAIFRNYHNAGRSLLEIKNAVKSKYKVAMLIQDCDNHANLHLEHFFLIVMVCYALRYMATGASYCTLRDTQGGVSSSTICRCVHSFIRFLSANSSKFIKFPKGADLHKTALKFLEKHSFAQVCGCIDGTYVAIQRPGHNEGAYVCRHSYHALNVMVVSDSDQRIIHVEPGLSGCNHDQAVLELSDLWKKIKLEKLLGNYFLLGDSGYGLSPHVMTPFRAKDVSSLKPWEARYQKAQTSCRSSVERTIGQLKTRWRCLSTLGAGVVKMDPLQASWLITACCCLHNLCLDWGVSEMSPLNNADPDKEDEIRLRAYTRHLRARLQVTDDMRPAPVRLPTNTPAYQLGLARRRRIMWRCYGGPVPNQAKNARRRRARKAR